MLTAPIRRLIVLLVLAAGMVLMMRVPAEAGANCSNLPTCITVERYITNCTNQSGNEDYGKISLQPVEYGDCISTVN